MRREFPIRIVAIATLLNGLIGVFHGLFVRAHEPPRLDVVLPFGVHHWSRLLTLVTGFAMLELSRHLWHRRRAAWYLAVGVSILATLAHLTRGHHQGLAVAPAATTLLLFALRPQFTVRSEPRSIVQGLVLLVASLAFALAYGTMGFWLLDQRDFGIEFHAGDALVRTVREYTLVGNSDLVPHTRHAHWFLDSLRVMGITAALYASFSLFRPLAFRLRTQPHERTAAERLLQAHGRSSLDYFKLWPDKSYFFATGGESFVAYRAAWGVAIGLGDPIGPAPLLEETVREFDTFCTDNAWRVAFHQTLPDLLDVYRRLGFGVLKIGEEAMVDLQTFATKTQNSAPFRRIRNRARTLGLQVTQHAPPLPGALLDELAEVSDEWLQLPGRRERGFTLGRFERASLAATPVFVVREAGGRALGFANEIPCWPAGDTSIDLMRHRIEIPNGSMDFLFMETLTSLAQTKQRFSLGLAPLAGVGDRPGASLEERAVHQIYERLNRFFSYKGLRSYKAKFEPHWEDRFLIYQGGPTGLLNAGVALTRITEG